MTKIRTGKNFGRSDIIEVLSKKKQFLLERFGVLDLAVFGSYARGEQRKTSDVDIYVELKKEFKTFDNFMELKFFLEEVLHDRKVDLVVKEAIREELKPNIFMEAAHV